MSFRRGRVREGRMEGDYMGGQVLDGRAEVDGKECKGGGREGWGN